MNASLRSLRLMLPIAGLAAGCTFLCAADRPMPEFDEHDRDVISRLVTRMDTTQLDQLEPIALQPYEIPGPSVDVMRVRMEETYNIAGVGKDTVELHGWIAVMHDRASSVITGDKPTWETAIIPTEFVGMHLIGESKIFGKVEVRLDPQCRVRGRVGALYMPFMQQVVADLCYRNHRSQGPASGPAYIAMLLPLEQRLQRGGVPVSASFKPSGPDEMVIVNIVSDVLAGINAKDPAKMLSHYQETDGAYFGANDALHTDTKSYAASLQQIFESVKEIYARPNDDMKVKLVGNTALVNLTGVNLVVDTEGHKLASHWKWSLQLEKKTDWKIVGEHLSFVAPRPTTGAPGVAIKLQNLNGELLPNISSLSLNENGPIKGLGEGKSGPTNPVLAPGPHTVPVPRMTLEDFRLDLKRPLQPDSHLPEGFVSPREINMNDALARCKCLASVSVEVTMPGLKLAMRTSRPVQWYSEVTTIPPIGETASMSVNSAKLESGGRELGTLISGGVKFREVVAREALNGTNTNPVQLAQR